MEYPAEALVLKGLCFALVIVSCLYLYFVAASVLNIIARKEANASSVAIQGRIGDLERTFFDLSQNVGEQQAIAMGLAPVTQTAYVYRPGNTASADFSDNGTTI